MGIPNHRFSIEKGREVSSFESGVDSIRRRLSNTITRSRVGGREIGTQVDPVSRHIQDCARMNKEFV